HVEPQQLATERELILADAELGAHVLAAPVPHLDRAAVEVSPHAVELAVAQQLELDAIRSAAPRTPAVERRDRTMGATIRLDPVERRAHRREQRRLAALVVVEDQVQALRVEGKVAAQRAEPVDLQPQQLHRSTPDPVSPRSS